MGSSDSLKAGGSERSKEMEWEHLRAIFLGQDIDRSVSRNNKKRSKAS